jgi:hypothetical protein
MVIRELEFTLSSMHRENMFELILFNKDALGAWIQLLVMHQIITLSVDGSKFT